jgi:3-methyladenine DNA glycosylase AlkD
MFEKIVNEIKASSSEEYSIFCAKMLAVNDGYGKGDIVIGCRVPDLRKIAKRHSMTVAMKDVIKLLHSEIHEIRLVALMIMVSKFENSDVNLRKKIVNLYLANTKYINNWDLVDLSCYKIVGAYFEESDEIFWKLANSLLLWDNRIAIVSTYFFIKKDSFNLTLKLAERFLNHEHHLIHKACGWMLREVGKRNETVLVAFLRKHRANMPKIMLSYAKERLKSVQI